MFDMFLLPLFANQHYYPFSHSQNITMGLLIHAVCVGCNGISLHYMKLLSPECSETKGQGGRCVFPGF